MSAPGKIWTKDPDAVVNFTIDWAKVLGTDTITTSTFTPDSGLTKDAASKTDSTSTVKLSGGTLGEDYDVLNRIVTAGGLTHDRTFRILVRQQ